MKVGNIYIIKNKVNDKVYIGQTTMTVHERFMAHLKPCTQKARRTRKLYNAISKYGRENFYVETLESNVPLEELNEREIYYIALYNSYDQGYNSTKGGDGRIINKIENEDILLSWAKSGMKAEDIAKQLNVNKATVFRTLHKLGFYYHASREYIVHLSEQGLSNKEIAKQLSIAPYTVSRALHRANKRRRALPIKSRKEFDYEGLKTDYYAQMPILKICEKYHIARTTFYRLKNLLALKSRPQIYKHKVRYYD